MRATEITWIQFKSLVSGGAKYKFFEDDERVNITVCDGGLQYAVAVRKTIINQTTRDEEANPDYTEFDTTYRTEQALVLSGASTIQPFASKLLDDGKKLYRRKHGTKDTIPANSSKSVKYTIPYAHCKIDEVEVINCTALDKIDLKILDSVNGDYSGTPNLLLNQFGFGVLVGDLYYTDTSNYDADLYLGMQIEIIYYNETNETQDVGFNFVLHEVV